MCGDVTRGGETCREFGVGTSVTLGLIIAYVGENNLRRAGRGREELGNEVSATEGKPIRII